MTRRAFLGFFGLFFLSGVEHSYFSCSSKASEQVRKV